MRSLAKHSLHHDVVTHLVTVEEEIVLKLLTKAEETKFRHGDALLLDFGGSQERDESFFDLLNCTQVRADDRMVAETDVPHLYSDLLFLGRHLGF